MLKKLLPFLLGVTLFSPIAAAKHLTIGVAMYSLSDKYPTYLQDSMKKFDQEKADVNFRYADANSDPARMLSDIETFIDSGVDALLVMPTDSDIIKAIGVKARKAKIPLVVVTNKPKDEDMKYIASYVGSEEITGGEMQAKFIVEQLKGKPANAIILMGPLGWDAQIKRTEGNENILKNHPEIRVLSKQEGKWDRAKAIDITENLLSGSQKIDVVISNNDEMAIGALLAARKKGIADKDMLIVGLDATPDALEYLGKGLDATIYQSASGQGYASAEMAYKAAKGEAVPKFNFIPFELVTPDKKAQYIVKYK